MHRLRAGAFVFPACSATTPPAAPMFFWIGISFYNVKLECTHSIYFSRFGQFKQAGTLDVCNVVSFSLQHAAHKIRTQAPLHSKKVNSAVTELALSRVGHELMSYLRLQAQSRPPAIPSTIPFYNVKLECTHSIYFSWFGQFKQAGTLDVCNVVSFSLQHAAHKIRAQAPLHSKKVNSAVTELALSRVGHKCVYSFTLGKHKSYNFIKCLVWFSLWTLRILGMSWGVKNTLFP